MGFSKEDLEAIEAEAKKGMKSAVSLRKELRKKESPTYRRLITKINEIIDGKGSLEQKKQLSYKLVNESPLTDYERNELLEQLQSIYR